MSFSQQLSERYPVQIKVADRIYELGRALLVEDPRAPTEAVIRYLTASTLRSHTASMTLIMNGFGADAIKVVRSIFEVLVSLRYLIARPNEIENFVYFDDVVRWQRLEIYKRVQPKMYQTIPAKDIEARKAAFERARDRFLDAAGRLRSTWHGSNIAEMARAVDLLDVYEVFYRYASSLHHSDPMGLSMLVDENSFNIETEPSFRHAGIALTMTNSLALEGLSAYARVRAMPSSSEEPHEYAELRELIYSEPPTDEGGPGSFSAALSGGKRNEKCPVPVEAVIDSTDHRQNGD